MAVNFDMFAAMCAYLDKNDWKYKPDQENQNIQCVVHLNCRLNSVPYFIKFDKFGFTVFAICPMKAAEDTRLEVMKYLTMVNFGLRNGNFEFDLSDGEIRYKIFVDAVGMDSIPDDVLEHCMILPAHAFERYGNGLVALLMGFSDAESEIAKVENN